MAAHGANGWREPGSDGFLGGGPADTLAFEAPEPKKPSFQTWIVVMRIILSFMLVLYHNHRIFDSYRHNMNIEPFDWEDAAWIRSIIKAIQRATLQAGLNIVRSFLLVPSHFAELAGAHAVLDVCDTRHAPRLSESSSSSFSAQASVSMCFGSLLTCVNSLCSSQA